MKKCSACKIDLPREAFAKNRNAKDGYQGVCRLCRKARYYDARPVDKQNQMREYYRQAARKRYAAETSKQTETRLQKMKVYRQENPGKLEAYRRGSLVKNAAKEAKRRANKQWATPAWLTTEQEAQIAEFYWLASDLRCFGSEDYEVDHIIPLNGKNVCGLHVPWNLQILPARVNQSKGNRL